MTTEHQRQNNKMKAPRALHGHLQQVLRDRVNEQVREVSVMVCPHNTGVDNEIISRKSSTWRHFSCNITGKKCVWRTSKRCANGALDLPQTGWQECARACVWERECVLFNKYSCVWTQSSAFPAALPPVLSSNNAPLHRPHLHPTATQLSHCAEEITERVLFW